ncbi:MAG: DUF1084 domain-containing protein [archaeon]|nr:DUF1084 domain-containing protein [archaeon]
MPGFTLCSSYLSLVIFWRALYLKPRVPKEQFVSNIIFPWSICVFAIFGLWIIFLVLIATIPDHQVLIHRMEAVYSSLLAFVISLLFMIWGVLLINKLNARFFGRSRKIVQSVVYLCGICGCGFLLRAVCVWLNAFVLEGNELGLYIDHWLLYVVCEFAMAWLLIYILTRSSLPDAQGESTNIVNSAGDNNNTTTTNTHDTNHDTTDHHFTYHRTDTDPLLWVSTHHSTSTGRSSTISIRSIESLGSRKWSYQPAAPDLTNPMDSFADLDGDDDFGSSLDCAPDDDRFMSYHSTLLDIE